MKIFKPPESKRSCQKPLEIALSVSMPTKTTKNFIIEKRKQIFANFIKKKFKINEQRLREEKTYQVKTKTFEAPNNKRSCHSFLWHNLHY